MQGILYDKNLGGGTYRAAANWRTMSNVLLSAVATSHRQVPAGHVPLPPIAAAVCKAWHAAFCEVFNKHPLYSISRTAKVIQTSTTNVRDWLAGKAFPRSSEAKRLYNLKPALRAHDVLLSVVHVVLQFKTFDDFDAAFQDVPWTNPQMDCLTAILRANNWQISGLRGSGSVVILDRLPAAPAVSPLHCLPEDRDAQDPEPDETPQEASATPPASLDTAAPHTPLAESPTDMTTTTTTATTATSTTPAVQPRDAATTRSLTREREEEVARDLKRFLRHSPKSNANVHLFAGALHMLRSASDMSTTDLASLLGLSDSVVRKWETGVVYPSARSFRRMAEVWPVLDELFDATVFRNSNVKIAEPTEDDPQPTEAAAPVPPPPAPAPAPAPPKQTPASTVAPPLDRVAFLNTIRYAVQHARGDSGGLHSLLAMSASRGILVQDLLNALEGKEP